MRVQGFFAAMRGGMWVAIAVIALLARPVAAQEVTGTQGGKVYHTHPAQCQGARQIEPENLVKWESAKQAEHEGRRLCRMCAKLGSSPSGSSVPRGTRPPSPKSSSKSSKPKEEPPIRRGPPPRTSQPAEEETPFVGAMFGRVKSVLPGGTLVLKNGEKVRLLGVICPAQGQPLADDAMRLIREKTFGVEIRLGWDMTAGSPARRDACGRMLAYIYISEGKIDLGGDLIANGLAWCDRTTSFERESRYVKMQEEAWWAGRGVWERLEGESGREEVVTGKYAAHFHSPGCRHVDQLIDAVKITINEAKGRQLTPCEFYRAKDKSK